MTASEALRRLVEVLDQHAELAIAVSGGVDSMVLAHVTHAHARTAMHAFHAVSPAVPGLATVRVEAHAKRHGWSLQLIDAGELADPAYRSNPVDRCFYCKSNLYTRIRAATDLRIASGTNVDDLSDYRPGLAAAERSAVLHPFVDAALAKTDIYALAQLLGLTDLAALPASPCLASRIETGIGVDATALHFIEAVETVLGELLPAAGAIRCRITAGGVYVECDQLPLGAERERVEQQVARLCADTRRRFAGLRPYRRGGTFLKVAG